MEALRWELRSSGCVDVEKAITEIQTLIPNSTYSTGALWSKQGKQWRISIRPLNPHDHWEADELDQFWHQ